MKNQIFLATNNHGKIERFRELLTWSGFEGEILIPQDFNLESLSIDENSESLLENAKLKALAYLGKVSMPIVSNDTGIWVEGEGLITAPKRITFGGRKEKDLNQEEKAAAMLNFWKNIARKNGGRVEAYWAEAFVSVDPSGKIKTAESRRDVILTDQEFGETHIQMPVRALYISKVTGKPACLHTAEEKLIEMKPVIEALKSILS